MNVILLLYVFNCNLFSNNYKKLSYFEKYFFLFFSPDPCQKNGLILPLGYNDTIRGEHIMIKKFSSEFKQQSIDYALSNTHLSISDLTNHLGVGQAICVD